MTPNPTTPDTIVLIHGLWLTPRSWEHWVDRYSSRGYKLLAPAWPGMEVEVEALRRDPSVMNGLGLTEVADHYARIIRGLGAPPIIMGHSFGGLLTQLLLDRGLGAASPTPSTRRSQGSCTTATTSRARTGRCGRPPPRSTSGTTTARRCY